MASNHIIKLRGLPFSATVDDIMQFLGPEIEILNGRNGVHITEVRRGRPSGECFVELCTEDDLELAQKKDKEHMGKRYIEVFTSDRQDMEWALNAMKEDFQNGNSLPHLDFDAPVVKLRGLPFGCSKEEVVDFFVGLEVESVMLLTDGSGRASGEAFVVFADADSAARALHKHRERMGHRYIEVFASDGDGVNRYAERLAMGGNSRMGGRGGGGGYGGRPAPYNIGDRFRGDRGAPFRGGGGDWMGGGRNSGGGGGWQRGGGGGGSTGFTVHMRGLPFKASQGDIADFFKPIRPVNINILMDSTNRPSGEADVDFACPEDAMDAMRKDKTNMEHRYIELFYSGGGGGGGGGGMGGGGRHPRGSGYGRNSYRM